jgi:hypothetical protein
MMQIASTDSAKTPRSKALLTWMIVSQILAIIPMLAFGGFGIFGYLLEYRVSAGLFFMYLAPLLMLIPLIGSWVAYARRNEKAAWILTSLPILYVCLDVMYLTVGIFF